MQPAVDVKSLHAMCGRLGVGKVVARATQLSVHRGWVIYVFDEPNSEYQLRATYGMTADMIAVMRGHHADFSEAVRAATQRREPDQVGDLQPSSRANELVMGLGYRARLVVPLLGSNRIVGALVVRRKAPGKFSQNTIELLQTFAAQSVLAIHRKNKECQNALGAPVDPSTGRIDARRQERAI